MDKEKVPQEILDKAYDQELLGELKMFPIVKIPRRSGDDIWMPYEQYLAWQEFEEEFYRKVTQRIWYGLAWTTGLYDPLYKHAFAKPGKFYRL